MTDIVELCEPEQDAIYGWFVSTKEKYPVSPGDIRCGYSHMYLTANYEVKHSTCLNNMEQFYFKDEAEARLAILRYIHGKDYVPVFNNLTSQPLFEEDENNE